MRSTPGNQIFKFGERYIALDLLFNKIVTFTYDIALFGAR
jgi:hypothetical protein